MNEPIIPPVTLLKIKFVFDKRWYIKYDIFKLGNTEYICTSKPQENENGKWIVEALPVDIMPIKDKYNTEFIKNIVSEIYQ